MRDAPSFPRCRAPHTPSCSQARPGQLPVPDQDRRRAGHGGVSGALFRAVQPAGLPASIREAARADRQCSLPPGRLKVNALLLQQWSVQLHTCYPATAPTRPCSLPPDPLEVAAFSLTSRRRTLAGSVSMAHPGSAVGWSQGCPVPQARLKRLLRRGGPQAAGSRSTAHLTRCRVCHFVPCRASAASRRRRRCACIATV